MVEKKLYTCEICHTDYGDKEKAQQCEKNHKLLKDAKIEGIYKSKNSILNGIPCKIHVKFPDLDRIVEYKL